jgi:thiamine-monophosphate kinase
MASEFELIRRYFTHPPRHTALAVGDDAALMRPAAGMELVISTDMLVAGTHFLPDTDPEALGWKTLAVNVSDIAAMGAEARWATLALSLPQADEAWIGRFAAGFFACCDAFDIDLIGGDTTRGPLCLCVTIFGQLPAGAAVLRSGAGAGDELWVSGQPGRAALALAELRGRTILSAEFGGDFLNALQRPMPRQGLGRALRGVASAMLDVSDGLLGDLEHILDSSQVGAVIEEARLPLAPLLAACPDAGLARDCLLGGGDDYELLFSAPTSRRDAVRAVGRAAGVPVHRIGHLTAGLGLQLAAADGTLRPCAARGFDHFKPDPV